MQRRCRPHGVRCRHTRDCAAALASASRHVAGERAPQPAPRRVSGFAGHLNAAFLGRALCRRLEFADAGVAVATRPHCCRCRRHHGNVRDAGRPARRHNRVRHHPPHLVFPRLRLRHRGTDAPGRSGKRGRRGSGAALGSHKPAVRGRERGEIAGLQLPCHRPAALRPVPCCKQCRQRCNCRRNRDCEAATPQPTRPLTHKVVDRNAAHLETGAHDAATQMPPAPAKPLQRAVDSRPHNARRQGRHNAADGRGEHGHHHLPTIGRACISRRIQKQGSIARAHFLTRFGITGRWRCQHSTGPVGGP